MKDRPDRQRLRALRRGRAAEYAAALPLICKGYRIVGMNFRVKAGEIDIIARKGDLVAFVEVKARQGVETALMAVGSVSEQRIRSASLVWIARQTDAARLNWRYDIVAVRPWRLPRHFTGMF